ncbi:MAG: cation transporter, partial [Duodenibacillus sp.]|nr:cation transporter [Duodenibacillus sp.]
VGESLQAVEGVAGVHDLHVWTMAPGHGAATAHIRVKEGADWGAVISDARAMLREKFELDHVTLQPEADK